MKKPNIQDLTFENIVRSLLLTCAVPSAIGIFSIVAQLGALTNSNISTNNAIIKLEINKFSQEAGELLTYRVLKLDDRFQAHNNKDEH